MNKHIYIDQILLYYDTILLFVGQDGVQTRYLCMLYGENEEDRYISVKISNHKLSLLLSGNIDLRSSFLTPEIPNEYYSLAVNRDGELEIVEEYQDIQEYMLPDEDVFVVSQTDYSNILQERIQYHRPIVHLGFVDAHNSHDIKASVLAPLIDSFQNFVVYTHKKIAAEGEARLIVPDLYIFNSSAASFNLHMYIQEDLNLFGGSSMDNTLNYINAILNFDNEQSLTESLYHIKGYAFAHYKRFITGLLDNDISIKTAWTTSDIDNPVAHNHISREKLQEAYSVIQKSTELEKEFQEFVGFFIKVDTTNGEWKLYDEANEKQYNGKCLDPNILVGIRIRTTDYRIYCSKTAEKHNITEKISEIICIERIEELGSLDKV